MIPISGTNAGQGSGFSLTDVSLETFNLSPGAGGEFCSSQFGLYGGGGGRGLGFGDREEKRGQRDSRSVLGRQ